MPHFVTSAQAEPHVLSMNDARLMAGVYGNGSYVLPTCNRMAATMVDSNTIRILNGDALMCGRHWSIDDAYEEYDIENGTPGMKRIDLVVARMSIAPAETVEIAVYKGEESASNPVTPAYVSGDLNNGDTIAEMPLYTVPIDGINAGEPVQQFRVTDSMVDAWDSISQTADELVTKTAPVGMTFTPNTALRNYGTYTNSSVRLGDLLVMQLSVILSTATDWTTADLLLGTLSASACPAADKTIYRSLFVDTSSGLVVRGATVGANGQVRLYNTVGTISGVKAAYLMGVPLRLNG